MNENYTDIVLLIDRSGSMNSIKHSMESAMGEFINGQRQVKGACRISAYQFDDVVETIYENNDIRYAEIPVIQPRSMTALYDAIGQTMQKTGERYQAMHEYSRPSKVFFVIITDGHENASREFQARAIADMVKTQRETYNWQFLFMGANIDSYAVGQAINIPKGDVLNYEASISGVCGMAASFSNCVTRKRGMSAPMYASSVQSSDTFSKAEQDKGDSDANS